MMKDYQKRLDLLTEEHNKLITLQNKKATVGNGIYARYENPILTAQHTPLTWRYDFDADANPFLMERIGVNATFNAGAMEYEEKFILAVRIEGDDRKSFFAIAESPNGIDNFKFWDYPITMPETDEPDINVYPDCWP